jgi:predicted RNase H-like nuclease (RuvC/YqgF family)
MSRLARTEAEITERVVESLYKEIAQKHARIKELEGALREALDMYCEHFGDAMTVAAGERVKTLQRALAGKETNRE